MTTSPDDRRTGSTPIGGSRIWATLRGTGSLKIDVVSGHPPHAAGRGEDRLRRAERKVGTYSALEARPARHGARDRE